jgi:hypothetical protein
MQNKLKKFGTVSVLVAMAFVPLSVAARTMPASSGKAVNWSENSCFGMNGSSMTNHCTSPKSFELPLTVDNAGWKTVYVTAYGASSANNVGCAAAGVNREMTAFWSSPGVWLGGFGSSQVLTLTNIYVPAGGYMFANCTMHPGGRVNVVDYNP